MPSGTTNANSISPCFARPLRSEPFPFLEPENMNRFIALSFALAFTVSTASAQEGILSRTGRALDNAGRGIRNAVDNGIAEGQMDAEEREVLNRVSRRLEWDKHLFASSIVITVQPGRVVTLRG
jgi:hypothetical protein